jgi:hypothetical protein
MSTSPATSSTSGKTENTTTSTRQLGSTRGQRGSPAAFLYPRVGPDRRDPRTSDRPLRSLQWSAGGG